MVKSVEQISSAAKNYAEALIMIGEEGLVPFDKLASDLGIINDAINDSADLREVFTNPSFTEETKASIVESIFDGKVDSHLVNFLKILISKNRINEFGGIYADFVEKLNVIHNIQPVKIVSAIELDDNYKNNIVNKLSSKISKTIQPEWCVDKDIIAGLKIKINDDVIDMSLKNRIDKLSKSLMLR